MVNRLVLFEHLRNAFYIEFNGTKETKEMLDKKFRTYKHEIDGIINNGFGAEFSECNTFIEDYNNALNKYVLKIYELIKVSNITIEDFIISHIHMHINRSFISKQRKHELVIYDILARYYKSQNNRNYENKNN
jgi:thiopeptide-type bacteriocin biosynthesis protein